MIKNGIIYLFSGVLNRLTPFILLPVLTRFLSQEEYGLVSLYQVAITFGIAILGFCLPLNIAKSWPLLKREDFGRLGFSVLLTLSVSCGIGLISVFILGQVWKTWLGLPFLWWLTVPVVTYFTMITLINQTAIRADNKPWLFASFEVSLTTLNLLISLFLVVFLVWGWEGRAVGLIVSSVIIGFFSLIYMRKRKWIIPCINKEQIVNVLIFSLPLLPHSISSAVMGVSDRIFLEGMVGKAELGIYSVGYSFGMVIMMITESFSKSWTPYFLSTIVDGGEKGHRKIVVIIYGFIMSIIVVVPLYVLIANFMVPFIVGDDFVSATKYISIVSFAYLFYGLYQLFFPFIVKIGATKILGVISTIGAVINIGGNYFLISSLGAIGAAWSTLISFAVIALLVMFVSLRYVRLPWLGVLKSFEGDA